MYVCMYVCMYVFEVYVLCLFVFLVGEFAENGEEISGAHRGGVDSIFEHSHGPEIQKAK